MKKPKYVIESAGSVGNTYRLMLRKTEVRMSFNDWLNFLRKLLVQEREFELSNATLMLCRNGFLVETYKPHELLVYADIDEATMKNALEQYVPKYGEKSIMK